MPIKKGRWNQGCFNNPAKGIDKQHLANVPITGRGNQALLYLFEDQTILVAFC